jgi:hypothetical protein
MRPRTSIEIDTYVEMAVSVYADYQPYEPATLETPAVEEDIEHITVYRGAFNITNTLTKEQLEKIEAELWTELEEPGTSLGAYFPDLKHQLDSLCIRGEN